MTPLLSPIEETGRMTCPDGCKGGFTYSCGDGWDEWDECRCCNPGGGNESGTVTPESLAEFRAAEAAEIARIDAIIAASCKVCGRGIETAELCDDCAKGNDPFVSSKYAGDHRP